MAARTVAILLACAAVCACTDPPEAPVFGTEAAADATLDVHLDAASATDVAFLDAAASPDAPVSTADAVAPAADVTAAIPGLWWRQFSAVGSSVDLGPIAVDSQGRTIVTGGCNVAVDMGIPVTQTGAGVAILFVAAYAPDGTPLWARRFGKSMPYSRITGIAIGPQDRIHLTGHFQGGPVEFGTGPLDNAAGTSNGSTDGFVAVLDANGNALWAARDGGAL